MTSAGRRIAHVTDLDTLAFATSGLVTVVAQDVNTGLALMVAHANRDALERTLSTGEMHYHSRSRGLWHKGATSGNTQKLVALYADCDADAILALVVPAGPACHTGAQSCFGDGGNSSTLARLDETIAQRGRAGESNAGEVHSYTRRLLSDRNLRLKKLGEECAELVAACADGDRARAIEEAADLQYHILVALRATGASFADLAAALASRSAPR
jgi:phosphoribosyl-ATP pyrophosphohydrolase/phosphoribosyl-AMP cyclohydrolase